MTSHEEGFYRLGNPFKHEVRRGDLGNRSYMAFCNENHYFCKRDFGHRIFSDYFITDIPWSWSLIFGVPGFLLISALIIFGDKRYAPEEDRKRLEKAEKITSRFEDKRTYLHPIKKRI